MNKGASPQPAADKNNNQSVWSKEHHDRRIINIINISKIIRWIQIVVGAKHHSSRHYDRIVAEQMIVDMISLWEHLIKSFEEADVTDQ